MATPVTGRGAGVLRQFLSGVGLLGRGLRLYGRSPGLVALGLLPALLSAALLTGALVALAYRLPELAGWVTGFAADWPSGWRDVIRIIAAVGIIGLAGLLGVVTFTAVTLVIGDPFYEKISERVEDGLGGVPDEVSVAWWRSLRRSAADSLRLVAMSVLVGIPLFAAGLVPVLGQTVVPVLGALVGGWFLAVELTGVPFQRRGLRLPDRRRSLRAHRPLALGFGAAVFVCFLIPFGAVLVMPAAVAGGTLLARRVLGADPARPASADGDPARPASTGGDGPAPVSEAARSRPDRPGPGGAAMRPGRADGP